MRGSRGVTMIEFVIMLALLGVVIGGIYEFVIWGAKSATVTNNFMQSQAQVRAALDNIVDEARWAQNVTAATATSVTFQITQSTPYQSGGAYAVSFAYNAATEAVTRQVGAGAAVPLAYLVAGPNSTTGMTFTYFDNGGTPFGSTPSAAQLPLIARVRATVAATSGTVTRSIAGDAALRAH